MTRAAGLFFAFPVLVGVFALGGHLVSQYLGSIDQLVDISLWVKLLVFVVAGLIVAQLIYSHVVAFMMSIANEPNESYISGVHFSDGFGSFMWSRPSDTRANGYILLAFMIISALWIYRSTSKLQLINGSWPQTIFYSSLWVVEAHRLVDGIPAFAPSPPTPQRSLPDNQPAVSTEDEYGVSDSDSAANVKRSEAAAADRIQSYGVSGLIESVNTCYETAEHLRKGKSLQYCFFLDLSAQYNAIRRDPQFFAYGMPANRLVAGLANVGVPQEDQRILANQWDAILKARSMAWRDSR